MVGPWIFDALMLAFNRLVGRPLQRLAADRSLASGQVKCAFRADDPDRGFQMCQRARVAPGRLTTGDKALAVVGVESIGEVWDQSRSTPFWFDPPVRTVALLTDGGTDTVVFLAWQVDRVLEILKARPVSS